MAAAISAVSFADARGPSVTAARGSEERFPHDPRGADQRHGDEQEFAVSVADGERPAAVAGACRGTAAEARHERRCARGPLLPGRAEDAPQLAVLVLDRRRVVEPEEEQRERNGPPARAR